MGNIYMVRHGETLWNNTMRFQGASDIALSDTGIAQAEKLAESFTNKNFIAIYSSDLQRAFKTADIVAKRKGLEVIKEPLIKEMSFGEWEGLNGKQINEKWPGSLDVFFEDPKNFDPPGGESFFQMQKRVCGAFYNICARHIENDILIVSHGGTIRAILADILKMDLTGIWKMRQSNTGVNIIARHGEDFVVNLVNSTIHLQ